MATLTVSGEDEALAFVAADAGGDQVPAGIENANYQLDGVVLLVNNGDTVAHTVTVQGVGHNVAAGDEVPIGVNVGVYPGTLVDVTYDAVTSVTVAAFKI